MEPREPAGWERGEGKSAEPSIRARAEGGPVGNTPGTVREQPRLRYPLTGLPRRNVRGLPAEGAPLPFSFALGQQTPPIPVSHFFKTRRTPHMKFENIKGSIVAMITPFRQDGSVNFDVLTELLERQIAGGTAAILTLGTTGEYSTMTHEEDAAVVAHTVKVVNGRVPVIVGSGSNSTATQMEKSVEYQDMGADALLLIAPYYNKANPEGMYRHFAVTADAVHIPCLLYNVPGRTGCSIPVPVVERLSKHPNIAGIKEASGDMSYAMKVARCVGPDFALYSGNDDITLPILSAGGSGVISVYANVMPAMCHQITADWFAGRQEEALANHLKYLDLMNNLFIEVNPIPVKSAMNMIGLNVGPMRLPLCEMSEEHQAILRASLKEAGLL